MSSSYQSDGTPRTCVVCVRPIELHEHMLDLFRVESAVSEPPVKVEWVHADCARNMIQVLLLKKRSKKERESDGSREGGG